VELPVEQLVLPKPLLEYPLGRIRPLNLPSREVWRGVLACS
jgi:hypothetical protein